MILIRLMNHHHHHTNINTNTKNKESDRGLHLMYACARDINLRRTCLGPSQPVMTWSILNFPQERDGLFQQCTCVTSDLNPTMYMCDL